MDFVLLFIATNFILSSYKVSNQSTSTRQGRKEKGDAGFEIRFVGENPLKNPLPLNKKWNF